MYCHPFNFIGAKAMLAIIGFVLLSGLARADEPESATTQAALEAYELGNAESKKGNFDAAIAAYTKAINLNPGACMAYGYRGIAYEEIGDYPKALSDYTAAIELKPDAPIASALYSDRGYMREQHGEFTAAFSDYNKAIELDPKNNNVLFRRGMTLAQKGKLQEAVIDFTTACEIDPSEYRSYMGRAMARATLSDFEGALTDITQAIKLSPNNSGCYLSYGYVLRKKRDYSAAISALTKAVDFTTSPATALSTRAHTYTLMGDFANALTDLNRVLVISPNFSRAYVHIGDIYFIEGNLPDALSAYRKAQSIERRRHRVRYAGLKADLLALRIEGVVPKEVFVSGEEGPDEDWSKSLERFVRGESSEKDLLDNATRGPSHLFAPHLAEAHFYIGELAIVKGDLRKARSSFEQSIATDRVDAIEYHFSKAELARLVEQKAEG